MTIILAILFVLLVIFAGYHAQRYMMEHNETEFEHTLYLIRKNKDKMLEYERVNRKEQEARLGHVPPPSGYYGEAKELRQIPGTDEYRPHGVYDRDQMIDAIELLTKIDMDQEGIEPPENLRMLVMQEVGDNRR